MAIPRIMPQGGGGVSLPRPLPPSEAAQIRRIFALQSRGDIPAALRATTRMDSNTPLGGALLGHILADRYLGPFTRPGADQLRDWLDRWRDLPDAQSIHGLLVVRLPAGETAPPLAPGITVVDEHAEIPLPEDIETESVELRRNPAFDRAVWNAARAHGPSFVERLLQRDRSIAPSYAAQLRGEAAQILFTLNRDDDAYELGAAATYNCAPGTTQACARAALAGYAAGLAAWRQDRLGDAQTMFEAAWRSDVTTSSLRAAAAYWAARTYIGTGDFGGALPWLGRAADEPLTFYGMIARRTLGLSIANGSRLSGNERQTLGEADVDAVAATPQGLRAFALLQVDQRERAAAELLQLLPAARNARGLARAITLVADEAGLPDVALRFADLLTPADGRSRGAVRLRVPHLRPSNGFTVDPAMIYGLARTESNFDTGLVSSAGARGLLQIMPDTAQFIVGRSTSEEFNSRLHDPAINLDLGQRYVAYLSKHEAVNGDLIRLLAAYNAGPANFGRWALQIRDNGDPLLFLEAIPIDETRAHVPRVLTYTWMYAARLRLPADSLDELAAGRWPRYHAFGEGGDAEERAVSSRLN